MKEYMSLKDYVYNYISEKINSGELTVEDKLSEIKISEALNISRTPIREALIQLASDGYLENLPRRGFKVKRLDNQKALELYEIIGSLEGKAGSLSVDNLTPKDIKQMTTLINKMEEAISKNNYQKYHDLQIEFHQIYINKCGNIELINLLKKLKMNFIRKTYSVSELDDLSSVLHKTNEEHKEILRLLIEKDKIALQNYIDSVHWSTFNSKFDSWE